MRVIPLPANQPPGRFYRGGEGIRRLRGDVGGATHEPEDWVASTTTLHGCAGTGLTTLPDGRLLRDAVAADPLAWLGPAHVARHGADTALLVKLLDAGQRLPVHAHPDAAFASQHLGSVHGKAEAWHVLAPGTVHLGLRRAVAAADLRALVDAQATGELLELLHAVEVTPGDTVMVPPGTLHAIGAGVLLVELQEPTDLSVLLEWDGFALDGRRDGHLGLGFDLALRAVDHDALTPDALSALVAVQGTSPPLPAAAHRWFRLDRRSARGAGPLPAGFGVLVVLDGEVTCRPSAGAPTTLPRGATAVVPYAAGPVALGGSGTLLHCRPPA